MVDRESRDLVADAIHGLAAGLLTNDQFEDSTRGVLAPPRGRPSRLLDPALRPILDRAWCLYGDDREYRLAGPHRLSPDARREILRWVLFLRSDTAYEWPPFGFVNPELETWSGCLLGLLTAGRVPLQRWRRQFAEWQLLGEWAVWPFLRRVDYDQVSRHFCPFAGLAVEAV